MGLKTAERARPASTAATVRPRGARTERHGPMYHLPAARPGLTLLLRFPVRVRRYVVADAQRCGKIKLPKPIAAARSRAPHHVASDNC